MRPFLWPALIRLIGAASLLVVVTVSAQPQSIELALNEQRDILWTEGGLNLSLQWLEVSDSRCPTDAVCVWAGEVDIRLAVHAGDAEGELILRIPGRDDVEAVAHVEGYAIRLDRVTPEASLASPPTQESYRAYLTVAPPGTLLPRPTTAISVASWGQIKYRIGGPGR